eukprot:COSAG01_NODE_47557_length_389_cov_0.834483_1_plen_103_part_10
MPRALSTLATEQLQRLEIPVTGSYYVDMFGGARGTCNESSLIGGHSEVALYVGTTLVRTISVNRNSTLPNASSPQNERVSLGHLIKGNKIYVTVRHDRGFVNV